MVKTSFGQKVLQLLSSLISKGKLFTWDSSVAILSSTCYYSLYERCIGIEVLSTLAGQQNALNISLYIRLPEKIMQKRLGRSQVPNFTYT